MDKIKTYLTEINTPETLDSSWNEGFVVGCAFAGLITNDELEALLTWLKEWYDAA